MVDIIVSGAPRYVGEKFCVQASLPRRGSQVGGKGWLRTVVALIRSGWAQASTRASRDAALSPLATVGPKLGAWAKEAPEGWAGV